MKLRAFQILLPAAAALTGLALGLFRQAPPAQEAGKRSPASADGRPAGEAAGDPVAQALAAALACRSLRDFSRLGPLLEQLDAAQMGAFVAGLERNARLMEQDFVSPVVAWWLERDPAAVEAWILPRLQRRFSRAQLAKESLAAVTVWAKAAPENALRLAREHPEHAFGGVLLRLALESWPDAQPAKRLELLRQFPEGTARFEALESYVSRWMQKASPEASREALSLAEAFPADRERQVMLEFALPRLAENAPMEALDFAAKAQLGNAQLWDELVFKAAKKDAPGAAAWLEAAGGQILEEHGARVAREWVAKDLPAALAWAAAHGVLIQNSLGPPDSRTNEFHEFFGRAFGRTDVLTRNTPFRESDQPVFQTAYHEDPQGTLAWLRAQPPGADRERWTELVAQISLGSRGGSPILLSVGPDGSAPPERLWPLTSLAPLLLELPPEAAANAVYSFAHNVGPWAPAETLRWAESLPPGRVREQAWLGIGESLGGSVGIPATASDRDALLLGQTKSWAQTYNSYDFDQKRIEGTEKTIFENLQKISNPEVRRVAFDSVFQRATNLPVSPEKAKAAAFAEASLERAPVPEEWKAPWRAKMKGAANVSATRR